MCEFHERKKLWTIFSSSVDFRGLHDMICWPLNHENLALFLNSYLSLALLAKSYLLHFLFYQL